jgi:hypothetical protein
MHRQNDHNIPYGGRGLSSLDISGYEIDSTGFNHSQQTTVD